MNEALETQIMDTIKNTGLGYQQIADALGVSYKVVYSRVHKYLTPEQISERKRANYRASKLGTNNPMLGKFGSQHHNFVGECSDGHGYLTVIRPAWYDSNARRVFVHHVNYCAANGLTRIPDGYVVHHIDHNPWNNLPANLQLMTVSEHNRLHARERATTKAKACRGKCSEAPDTVIGDDIVCSHG